GAESVIVMPNNKNVIMAAERVAELVPEKTVKVLPTRTLGQGLAAAVSFNEVLPADILFDEMREAAESTVTLEVTSASREAEIDGVAVSEGQAIGLVDGVLETAAHSYEEALLALLTARAPEHDVASLFHSVEVAPERAQAVLERIEQAYPELEVEMHAGAPDLYPYLMVLE